MGSLQNPTKSEKTMTVRIPTASAGAGLPPPPPAKRVASAAPDGGDPEQRKAHGAPSILHVKLPPVAKIHAQEKGATNKGTSAVPGAVAAPTPLAFGDFALRVAAPAIICTGVGSVLFAKGAMALAVGCVAVGIAATFALGYHYVKPFWRRG